MDPMTLMALMSSVGGAMGGGGGQRPPMPMMEPGAPSPMVQPGPVPHIGGAAQGGGGGMDPNDIFTHQIAQMGQMPPAQAMQLAQMNLAAAQSAGHPQQVNQWQSIIGRMHQAQLAQTQQQQDIQQQIPKPMQPNVAQAPAGVAGPRPIMGPAPAGINPGAMIRGTLGGGY